MSEYRVIAIGLPSVCDNDYLYSYFQTCGEILDCRVIYDKKTGNPRGLGFISFGTEEATLKALELNGCTMEGRTIRVEMSKTSPLMPQGYTPASVSLSSGGRDDNKIVVTKIAEETTADTLREAFSPYGTIESCNIVTDKITGKSRGMAMIKFSSKEEMDAALSNMNKAKIDGRRIGVREYFPVNKNGQGGFPVSVPVQNKSVVFEEVEDVKGEVEMKVEEVEEEKEEGKVEKEKGKVEEVEEEKGKKEKVEKKVEKKDKKDKKDKKEKKDKKHKKDKKEKKEKKHKEKHQKN